MSIIYSLIGHCHDRLILHIIWDLIEDHLLDAEFHRQLCQSAGNRLIRDIYHTLDHALNESRSRFLQSHGRRRASAEGHLKIIDALEKRSPQGAFAAMREHLLEVEKMIFQTRDAVEGEE